MTGVLSLVSGVLLLLIIIADFFYTTLSGSGAAFITRFMYRVGHKVIHFAAGVGGRNVFRISGLVINLLLVSTWVVIVWLGLFLVYSYQPSFIVDSAGRIADGIERLYFTGYVLSTLGVGNFFPTSPFFELATSVFSFFGFVFFTTTMTYLISVSSAVVHKRTLALYIHNLGQTPEELLRNILEKDPSYSYQVFSSLQQMIDRHSVYHQAYPVLHYYGNADVASSFSLNLTILDEAVSLLLRNQQADELYTELQPLRRSLTSFLLHMEEKYRHTLYSEDAAERNLPKAGEIPHRALPDEPAFKQRRQVLGGLLRSEHFGWNDVYSG